MENNPHILPPMSTYIEKSIRRIQAYGRHMNWGHTRYAAEAGLDRSSMRKLYKPGWMPNARTLAAAESIIPEDFHIVDDSDDAEIERLCEALVE